MWNVSLINSNHNKRISIIFSRPWHLNRSLEMISLSWQMLIHMVMEIIWIVRYGWYCIECTNQFLELHCNVDEHVINNDFIWCNNEVQMWCNKVMIWMVLFLCSSHGDLLMVRSFHVSININVTVKLEDQIFPIICFSPKRKKSFEKNVKMIIIISEFNLAPLEISFFSQKLQILSN